MSRIHLLCVVLIGMIAACVPFSGPDTPPTPTGGCEQLTEEAAGPIDCVRISSSAFLIQSPANTQATLNVNGAAVTVNGTIFISYVLADMVAVATLEGVGVIGVAGTTRVIQPGAQVVVWLNEQSRVDTPPSPPHPFDFNVLRDVPLETLPRQIGLPATMVPPAAFTPFPSPTRADTALPPTGTLSPSGNGFHQAVTDAPRPTGTALPPIATQCVVRDDWIAIYLVQRGDTLGEIARLHDIDLSVLQIGNCLEDANTIRIGQQLQVPDQVVTPPPANKPPSPTPSVADFRADQTNVQPGQCTSIRWEVENVRSVFLDQEPTTEQNTRLVCPAETTTYTLLVVHPDGDQQTYQVTITVGGETD